MIGIGQGKMEIFLFTSIDVSRIAGIPASEVRVKPEIFNAD